MKHSHSFHSHSFLSEVILLTSIYSNQCLKTLPTKRIQKKKTVGFKVTPHEYIVLKQYTKILHEQMIQDPETGQQRRMIEKPEIGLLICVTTYRYTVHMNEIFTIVKADGSLCEAVFIDDLTASIS
jgi:hypothetical protein